MQPVLTLFITGSLVGCTVGCGDDRAFPLSEHAALMPAVTDLARLHIFACSPLACSPLAQTRLALDVTPTYKRAMLRRSIIAAPP